MDENETKNVLTSKTAVGNLLIAIVAAFVPSAKDFITANPEASVAFISALNIVLRLLTKKGVHIVKDF